MELAQQMAAEKLQSPVQVQPGRDVLNGLPEPYQWRLIAGFRRFAAASLLKWTTIPAFIREGLSEDEAKRVNFTENIERVDLSMMEQARGLARMYPKGTPVEQICKHLNKTRGWVKSRLALLNMPLRIQEEVKSNTLTQYDVERLSRLPPEGQLQALERLRIAKETHQKPGRKITLRITDTHRRRSKTEMLDKSVEIATRIGEGPWNWVLAWAAGMISTEELDSNLDSWDG